MLEELPACFCLYGRVGIEVAGSTARSIRDKTSCQAKAFAIITAIKRYTDAPHLPHPTIMTTSSGSIARLLVLGILFHLVYIGTVFDCYFTSPVVHGMRQFKLPQAQARRLVLIVGTHLLQRKSPCLRRKADVAHPHMSGDGLRADFAFTANASRIVPGVPERVAPYLRDVIENRGAYGVSHTHVPTESRPGHVAIIGASCPARLFSARGVLTPAVPNRRDVRGRLGRDKGDPSTPINIASLCLPVAESGMEDQSGALFSPPSPILQTSRGVIQRAI